MEEEKSCMTSQTGDPVRNEKPVEYSKTKALERSK
jgi:hypothetical protein